jgi:hypothetical protein
MNLGAENAALHDWRENVATKQWSKNKPVNGVSSIAENAPICFQLHSKLQWHDRSPQMCHYYLHPPLHKPGLGSQTQVACLQLDCQQGSFLWAKLQGQCRTLCWETNDVLLLLMPFFSSTAVTSKKQTLGVPKTSFTKFYHRPKSSNHRGASSQMSELENNNKNQQGLLC